MKQKPILIISGILILAACVFLFMKSRIVAKPEEKEVVSFMGQLNYIYHLESADSLAAYFEGARNNTKLLKLLRILVNKTGLNGLEKPFFKTNLLITSSQISFINNELVQLAIPVQFDEGQSNQQQSLLTINIHKNAKGKFMIVNIDSQKFIADYTIYEKLMRYKHREEDTHYSDITLSAFTDADKLKSKYDTVIWFAHVNKKTFYYVVKGNWDEESSLIYHSTSDPVEYKMGLIGPDMKEIIPPEYDLIYTVNGTLNNMIEVEKDHKRGFYNLSGQNTIPVIYDQILPINDESNLAILRNGNDYFYLKKDTTISPKVDLKVSDFFSKIKIIKSSFTIDASFVPAVMEYNSKNSNSAFYIAPSYLIDMDMANVIQYYKNPLRTYNLDYEYNQNYNMAFTNKEISKPDNWLEGFFYSIKNYFVGGREGFYDKTNIVIIDKKHDKVFSNTLTNLYDEPLALLKGTCSINNIKIINDSLFEIKVGAHKYVNLYNSPVCLTGGPVYQYLAIRNNKLIKLPNNGRLFDFTQYIKMDDSYLQECYLVADTSDAYKASYNSKRSIDHVNAEMLRYMKNEIYASYDYKFKDPKWNQLLYEREEDYNSHQGKNVNVTDSLTAIDKYNISFIEQKLKKYNLSKPANPTKPNSLAAK